MDKSHAPPRRYQEVGQWDTFHPTCAGQQATGSQQTEDPQMIGDLALDGW